MSFRKVELLGKSRDEVKTIIQQYKTEYKNNGRHIFIMTNTCKNNRCVLYFYDKEKIYQPKQGERAVRSDKGKNHIITKSRCDKGKIRTHTTKDNIKNQTIEHTFNAIMKLLNERDLVKTDALKLEEVKQVMVC